MTCDFFKPTGDYEYSLTLRRAAARLIPCLLITSMLCAIGCVADSVSRMRQPPLTVVAAIETRLNRLRPGMNDPQILAMLGLEPYRAFLMYTARLEGGIGVRGNRTSYLDDYEGYSLAITHRLDGSVVVNFRSPTMEYQWSLDQELSEMGNHPMKRRLFNAAAFIFSPGGA